MATRSTNSLAELLQKFTADLAQYQLIAPDSEMPQIQQLQDTFLQIARAPIDSMAQQGITGAPPQFAQQGPPQQGPPPQGVPGMNMMPGPVNGRF